MKTFQEFLKENVQIGLAKYAYRVLSAGAKDALDQWETSGWVGGKLEQHVRANDDIAREIETAFAPIRAKLPPKIKLYRGMIRDENASHHHGRLLESWTDDKKVAEHFAGLRQAGTWNSYEYKIYSDHEIAKAVDTYNKTGFVTFDGYRYVRNKAHPEYFDIYDRNRQPLTDGSDLEDKLRTDNENRKELNDAQRSQGVILEKMVSRDRIVWITNNLNSKEYIVRV
jgi:hypothetical protein